MHAFIVTTKRLVQSIASRRAHNVAYSIPLGLFVSLFPPLLPGMRERHVSIRVVRDPPSSRRCPVEVSCRAA